jgi:hypothetical protein
MLLIILSHLIPAVSRKLSAIFIKEVDSISFDIGHLCFASFRLELLAILIHIPKINGTPGVSF